MVDMITRADNAPRTTELENKWILEGFATLNPWWCSSYSPSHTRNVGHTSPSTCPSYLLPEAYLISSITHAVNRGFCSLSPILCRVLNNVVHPILRIFCVCITISNPSFFNKPISIVRILVISAFFFFSQSWATKANASAGSRWSPTRTSWTHTWRKWAFPRASSVSVMCWARRSGRSVWCRRLLWRFLCSFQLNLTYEF